MRSVTRKAESNRQRRRAELGQQLLAATERLMVGQGLSFSELTVDRLAVEAGISRATFYVYFEDKSQLVRELAARVFAELTEDAHSWWDVAERQDPADTRRSLASIIATYRRHQSVLTAVIEMAAYDLEVAAAYRNLLGSVIDEVEGVIAHGRERGAIGPLPVRETASSLTWMVERACHQNLRFSERDNDGRLADALTEVVWRTLYLRSANTAEH